MVGFKAEFNKDNVGLIDRWKSIYCNNSNEKVELALFLDKKNEVQKNVRKLKYEKDVVI